MDLISIIRLKHKVRRNSREWIILLLIFLAILAQAGVLAGLFLLGPSSHQSDGFDINSEPHRISRRSVNSTTSNATAAPVVQTTVVSIGDFPPDAFTPEQLGQGAVILHTLGLIYMFIGLAIVCDEFFVPTLEVIIQRCEISEDVAGATFMAAGGSAPELFTSLFGVFVSRNSVGIGTIVGSAVFNILFVIGMCAVFSREVLQLTWWPLFRDVMFYSISLVVLIICYLDPYIYYYEAIILLLCYAAYVIFMRFNAKAEKAFKGFLKRHKIGESSNKIRETTPNPPSTAENGFAHSQAVVKQEKNSGSQKLPKPVIRPGSAAKYRHGILQLMIQTLDPLGEGQFEERALRLHAITSLQVTLNPDQDPNGNVDTGRIKIEGSGTYYSNNSTSAHSSNSAQSVVVASSQDRAAKSNSMTLHKNPLSESTLPAITDVETMEESQLDASTGDMTVTFKDGGTVETKPADQASTPQTQERAAAFGDSPSDDEENQPLDLSWPTTNRKRLTYVLVAPIVYPLWLTLPDVRKEHLAKFYPWTFIGSIIWIAIYSYLMLWWVSTVGVTMGIPIQVLGLTIIAAGTSVPDLLTSVIVARKGYGDMAVSSSIGSNIFDVTVGLPFPWLLGCLANISKGAVVSVSSDGLVCAIILLFIMLVMVVISIACFRWRMNRWLGLTMFGLYVVFLVISLLLSYKFIPCIEVNLG